MHATVCPRCRATKDHFNECPRCGSGIIRDATRWQLDLGDSRPEVPWQQAPAGRVLLGTLLAIGLCFGLLQIGMAALGAFGIGAGETALNPLTGLILFQSLQVVALLGGGMLAGGGQERGTFLGGLVGILTSAAVLGAMLAGFATNVVQSYSGELLSPGSPTHDLIMFALPVQNLIIGAIGGLLGSRVWKPIIIPTDPRYSNLSNRSGSRREQPSTPQLRWTGPVAWLRVLMGAGIAVAGALNAGTIVDFILRVSDHKLQLMTHVENQVAYGEVFGLFILLGGCFAGATRVNGLKQGVCAGILVAVVMVGTFHRTVTDNAPSVIFPIMSALFLCPIGGWFGSELLPPVSKRRFRVRFWS